MGGNGGQRLVDDFAQWPPLLDDQGIDWESSGMLEAHEPNDRRIRSNIGKRKESDKSMDLVPSESNSRPKRQRIEHAPGGSGKV